MSKNNSVFNRKPLVQTARSTGDDSRINISWKDAAHFGSMNRTDFLGIEKPPRGQSQTIISSGDQVMRVLANQLISAMGLISIESEDSCIQVKAATEITLEVGSSKLTLQADGTIKLTGLQIVIEGDDIQSNAVSRNLITGKRVDINF